jgi:hypothetical protein
MNLTEDPLRVVADLRPASHDGLADEAYARNRAVDLARALGESGDTARPSGLRVLTGSRRGRILASAGAGLVAAAVAAAVVITVPSSHGHPALSASGGGTSTVVNGSGGGQGILLTVAHTAAALPAATGTYWYVKERDFEPTTFRKPGKRLVKGEPASKDPGFDASYAATEESWTGASRTRTIVNENLAFNFSSATGKAKWKAAGEPPLVNPSGKSGFTGPVTSNYAFGGYSYNAGTIKVSIATARKLPTTPGKLNALLLGQWKSMSPAQQQAAVGLLKPTYAEYVFEVAGALLTGPVTPGTKAAVFGLLAKQPGLSVAKDVTDPLGRVGIAVGTDSVGYLVIDPITADVLDLTSAPVRARATIPATRFGTEAYLSLNWTNRLP